MTTFLNAITTYGLTFSTFIISIASGFIPFINSELFLIIVSSTISRMNVVSVAVVAALGQMIAKVVMYLSGRGIFHVSFVRYETKVNAMIAKLNQWESKLDLILFVSAFTGFPPFYVLTVALGMAKYNLIRFTLIGFAGRLLRFILILIFPQYFKDWIA
jgi:membrane protein YqaA with SNARE-associated domain